MSEENQTADVESVSKSEFDAIKAENTRMQAKLDELLAETKKAKDAKRQAEEEAKLAADDKAKRENDFEQLYKSAQARIDALEAEKQAVTETQIRERKSAEAMKLAQSLTKDTAKAELLAEKIGQRISIDAEGVKVLDESGNLTVSKVADLVGSIKERYAFLVDANGSTGGGATGANSGAVKATKKFTDYSGAELSALRKSDPSEYTRLRAEYNGA